MASMAVLASGTSEGLWAANMAVQNRAPPCKQSFSFFTPKTFRALPRISCTRSLAPSETFGVTESGKFTVSNEDLQSRGFECFNRLEGIDLDQLNTLFVKVGFPRRQKDKLLLALQNSTSVSWLKDVRSQQMIGFARATGDSVFNAVIWDVVVDPSYQKIGLGRVIMERLVVNLVKQGISTIALYAEPRVVGFYRPLGFAADPDGICAMAYLRRRR